MTWRNLKELNEKRNKLVHDAGELLKKVKHDEKRDFTPEEEKKFEDIHSAADELLKQIEQFKKQDAAEDSIAADDEQASKEGRWYRPDVEQRSSNTKQKAEFRDKAFAKYIRGFAINEAEQRALRTALTIGGEDSGAEAVPQSFYEGFYEALRDVSSVRQAKPQVNTPSDGRSIPYPIYDDTANKGEIIVVNNSNAATADTNPATDQLVLGGHVFSSKTFSLAKNFIQDAAGNPEGAVQRWAVERIAAASDELFTIGTGTGQPQGAVTGASVGKTATSDTAVTYNELLDTIHSMPRQYRKGAYLMFNDSTHLALKKLVDNDGNSIWFSGSAGNAGNAMPATIAGEPYIVNPWMPDMEASAKPILYANWTVGYLIHDVQGGELHVDPYTGGSKYMINYTYFSRHDGGVLVPSAFKVLQMDAGT